MTLALLALLVAGSALAQENQQRRRREQRQPVTYHVAPDGDDANPGTADRPFATIQKGANSAGPDDTVLVRGGTYGPVTLTTSGRYFGRYITIRAAEGEEVVIDGSNLDEPVRALFDTNGSDYVHLKGITVRNAPRCGIGVYGSWRIIIDSCKTDTTQHSGIIVDKSGFVEVVGNEVTQACVGGGEESVSVKRSQDVNVGHNHIHHTGHEGIDIKEGSKHVRVFNNHVHDVERQALYADSWDVPTTDIRFENNVVHDCMFGIVAGAETGGLLSDVWFVNNVVYNMRGPGMVVQDWGGGQRFAHPIKDVYFINNTVYNTGNGGRAGDWGGAMYFENPAAENVVVRNNILADSPQGAIVVRKPPASAVVENNLIAGPPGETMGEGNVIGEAMFADPANGDFRLRAGSPAIDAGASELAPETDIAGTPRLIDAGVDVGAYEHAAN